MKKLVVAMLALVLTLSCMIVVASAETTQSYVAITKGDTLEGWLDASESEGLAPPVLNSTLSSAGDVVAYNLSGTLYANGGYNNPVLGAGKVPTNGFKIVYRANHTPAVSYDLTGMNYVEFDMYLSNVSVLEGKNFFFELSSAGTQDKEEIASKQTLAAFKGSALVNGWNHFEIPLATLTQKTGGNFDPTAWDFFRIYSADAIEAGDGLTVAFKNIYFSAVSGEEMVLSAGSVKTYPGKTGLQVPISVDNNPGICFFTMTPKYAAGLNATGVVNGSAFTGEEFTDNYIWEMTNNDMINNENNGTIATVTFSIPEATAYGDYAVGAVVRECFDHAPTDYNVVVFPGTVTVAERVIKSTFEAAQVALGTDISVNFYVSLDEAHAGAQLKVTLGSADPVLLDGTDAGDGRTLYVFQGVAPQSMGDNIKAEVMFEDQAVATLDDYSVKAYCTNMLGLSAADLKMSADKYAAFQTLVKDMLVYGAKAQLYRGHNTSNLVDADVTGSAYVDLTDNNGMFIEETGYEGYEVKAAGMYFDYTNSMYIRFTTGDLAANKIQILVTNTANDDEFIYTLDDCTAVEGEENMYVLVMDPIMVSDYDALYVIELQAITSGTRFRTQQELDYSVASYVYNKQGETIDGSDELTAMANLARATYNYGKAAKAYAAAQ